MTCQGCSLQSHQKRLVPQVETGEVAGPGREAFYAIRDVEHQRLLKGPDLRLGATGCAGATSDDRAVIQDSE